MGKTTIKAVFSNNYNKMMNEFPKLPSVCVKVFSSALKRDALRTMKEFKEGIKQNTLGLKRLKDVTIKAKEKQGLPQPTYPLYGAGDEKKKNSYMNMLRIKEKGQGFTVFASPDMHHSENIALDKLWDIHEHGVIIHKGKAKIMRGPMGKGDLIRIPPRPALRKALERSMRQRNPKETGIIAKSAIILFIKSRNKAYLEKAQEYFLKGLESYEVNS